MYFLKLVNFKAVNKNRPGVLLLSSIVFFAAGFITGCSSTGNREVIGTDDLSNSDLPIVVEPWEDGLRTNPDGKSFEWWYFDASFTDGSTAVIFFSTKSFLKPAGKMNPEVNLVITDPQGNKIETLDTPGKNLFSSSRDHLDVKIGKSFVTGNLKKCQIYFDKNGVRADLSLVSMAPAWRPGSGISYYGKEKNKYFAWLAAIPYGKVDGTLVYNGKSVKVTGSGYHDHNWGNVRLDKIQTQWYWGRARIDDYTIIFSRMLTAPRYGSKYIPVFYLAKGEKILSKQNYTFSFFPSNWRRHIGGRDYPQKIDLEIKQDDMNVKFVISNPITIEAQPLLERAPFIVRILARPFTNPYYFRFKSDFSIALNNFPSTGSSAKTEDTITREGSGIFEMMLLRGLQTVR